MKFQCPMRIYIRSKSTIMSIDITVKLLRLKKQCCKQNQILHLFFSSLIHKTLDVDQNRLHLALALDKFYMDGTYSVLIFYRFLFDVLELFCEWKYVDSPQKNKISNDFSGFIAIAGLPVFGWFLTPPISSKRLIVLWIIDFEILVQFSFQNVALKSCFTSLYDLSLSPHPLIIKRDIRSRSVRCSILKATNKWVAMKTTESE